MARRSRLARFPWAVLGLLALLTPSRAQAQQVFESVGERALGMGGAFVAVADDATAVYWNPAGLVHGSPGAMTIGWYRFQSGNPTAAPYIGPDRRNGSLTAIGSLPLGMSYSTFQTAALAADSNGIVHSETLRTRAFGITILQQVVSHVVMGTTLKYVRGSVATGPATAATVDDALKQAGSLEASSTGALDLDIGVMADLSRRIRLGGTVRNLRSPSFGGLATSATTLQRQARVGLAIFPGRGVTLAMDLDLDTVDLRDGLRRMCALGGEARLGRHLAIRSGLRWNLEQAHRLVGTVGLSVSVRSGLWLDGHFAQGRYDEDRELGLALRAGF